MRKLVRWKNCSLSRNHYFVVGLLFGLILTLFIPEDAWNIASDECPDTTDNPQSALNSDDFEPHINMVNKPMSAKKIVKNIVRPRYYSSELGIREKLFVGVMTSQKNINSLATAFNKTAAHLVNKIKYFINADNVKSNFKLKNIVGFTDTRENLRPFHVLKYIADNYLNDFDYFLIGTDEIYVDARRLLQQLYHISISFDVYIGRRIESDANELSSDERDFCDLNAGIVLSSSVIRQMRANLDWCVRNAVTNFHSLNIGRCVKYSSKLAGCQQSFQGINITSFSLNTYKVHRDLSILKHNKQFNDAIFLYPANSIDDFYILHIYFSKLHLDSLKSQHIQLEKECKLISNGTISNDILEVRWPLGVPELNAPETRHDIIPWTLLNVTHQFMPDHELNTKLLSRIEMEDFQKVLNQTLVYAIHKYPDLNFINIHTAYRRFDPVRGMDYQLHLNFWNRKSTIGLTKSFHAVKPLGQVEFISSPYVTESTRIAMLLPTFEHQVNLSVEFLKRYEKTCMKNHDNTFLMLVFLYRSNTPSKGSEDIFYPLKKLAIEFTETYKADGSRIAWVSIRLPEIFNELPQESDIMLSSMYAQNEILSVIVADIALRKIGLESLIMICSVSMTFKTDFLNRIRMNTVQGFQIFSPIGFMMYPCNFLNLCKDCETCDVSQGAGYFDRNNTDVIAFYSRDYIEARKALEALVPIVHIDSNIENFLSRADQSIKNIADVFVRSQLPIHILRAIEPNLRFGNAIRNYVEQNKLKNIPMCPYWNTENANKCIHIASRKNIGDALLKYENRNQNKVTVTH